jgi:hypothetical protein
MPFVETQLQFESKSFLPTTTVSFVDEDETTSHLDREDEAAVRTVGGEELPFVRRARCSEGGQD